MVGNGSFRSIPNGSNVMRVLRITNNQGYTVNGVRVYHQFSDTKNGFAHRLAINGIASDWNSYSGIALFMLGKRIFAATTDYYGSALPRVFEIIGGKKDVQEN